MRKHSYCSVLFHKFHVFVTSFWSEQNKKSKKLTVGDIKLDTNTQNENLVQCFTTVAHAPSSHVPSICILKVQKVHWLETLFTVEFNTWHLRLPSLVTATHCSKLPQYCASYFCIYVRVCDGVSEGHQREIGSVRIKWRQWTSKNFKLSLWTRILTLCRPRNFVHSTASRLRYPAVQNEVFLQWANEVTAVAPPVLFCKTFICLNQTGITFETLKGKIDVPKCNRAYFSAPKKGLT